MGWENRRLESRGRGTSPNNLRAKIQASQAIDTLNRVIQGTEEVSQTRLKAIQIALNKCLPDLQMVAVDINDNRPATMEDINSRMAMLGLSSDNLWSMLASPQTAIEGTAEKVEADPIQAEPPIPGETRD